MQAVAENAYISNAMTFSEGLGEAFQQALPEPFYLQKSIIFNKF